MRYALVGNGTLLQLPSRNRLLREARLPPRLSLPVPRLILGAKKGHSALPAQLPAPGNPWASLGKVVPFLASFQPSTSASSAMWRQGVERLCRRPLLMHLRLVHLLCTSSLYLLCLLCPAATLCGQALDALSCICSAPLRCTCCVSSVLRPPCVDRRWIAFAVALCLCTCDLCTCGLYLCRAPAVPPPPSAVRPPL